MRLNLIPLSSGVEYNCNTDETTIHFENRPSIKMPSSVFWDLVHLESDILAEEDK